MSSVRMYSNSARSICFPRHMESENSASAGTWDGDKAMTTLGAYLNTRSIYCLWLFGSYIYQTSFTPSNTVCFMHLKYISRRQIFNAIMT